MLIALECILSIIATTVDGYKPTNKKLRLSLKANGKAMHPSSHSIDTTGLRACAYDMLLRSMSKTGHFQYSYATN